MFFFYWRLFILFFNIKIVSEIKFIKYSTTGSNSFLWTKFFSKNARIIITSTGTDTGTGTGTNDQSNWIGGVPSSLVSNGFLESCLIGVWLLFGLIGLLVQYHQYPNQLVYYSSHHSSSSSSHPVEDYYYNEIREEKRNSYQPPVQVRREDYGLTRSHNGLNHNNIAGGYMAIRRDQE